MPVHVEKHQGPKPWKVVEKGGKVVGSSKTKTNADASCRARNAAYSKGRN